MEELKKEILPLEPVEQMPVKKSPIEIASSLIEQKADPEFIQRMLDVQVNYEKNEARKAYHVAMAEFKKEPIKILKDKSVGYTNKKGQFVGYSHASLGNVTESINSKLSDHGFSTSWKTDQTEKDITVTCTVTHALGHSESTSLAAPADTSGNKNTIQAIGSTVSYLSRYTLLAITGQATYDQDDDGQLSGNQPQQDRPGKSIITRAEYDNLLERLKEKNISHDTVIKYFNDQDKTSEIKDVSELFYSQYIICLEMIKTT
jgi:hypothetical protein